MKVATLFSAICLLTSMTRASAQTPVQMADEPGLSFTEDFSDLDNWEDDFASGIGADHWSSVAVNSSGTIPDGYTTSVATDAFKYGFSAGIQKSPSTTTEKYLAFLVNGSTDNSDAIAIDFHVDFSGLSSGELSFDAASVNNGVKTSNRVSTLSVYYSTDGNTFSELPGASYIATNYYSAPATVSVSLPDELNGKADVIFRFYEYNGSGGDNGSRPKISIDNLTVTANDYLLPLTLEYFKAQQVKENVQLRWMTDSEQNTSYFAVQRSNNGNSFSTITRVNAKGFSNMPVAYDYLDLPDSYNKLFYRLKMVDKDGRFKYSKIISLSHGAALSGLYPNPAHNMLKLHWDSPTEEKKQIQLIDASGKVCKTVYLQAGKNELDIPVQTLPDGQYWVRIGNDSQPVVFPFIKQ
jgi:Secretion system C-terminal sorting domain